MKILTLRISNTICYQELSYIADMLSLAYLLKLLSLYYIQRDLTIPEEVLGYTTNFRCHARIQRLELLHLD